MPITDLAYGGTDVGYATTSTDLAFATTGTGEVERSTGAVLERLKEEGKGTGERGMPGTKIEVWRQQQLLKWRYGGSSSWYYYAGY
eukprot:3647059-Rhodomonas_salina.1